MYAPRWGDTAGPFLKYRARPCKIWYSSIHPLMLFPKGIRTSITRLGPIQHIIIHRLQPPDNNLVPGCRWHQPWQPQGIDKRTGSGQGCPANINKLDANKIFFFFLTEVMKTCNRNSMEKETSVLCIFSLQGECTMLCSYALFLWHAGSKSKAAWLNKKPGRTEFWM